MIREAISFLRKKKNLEFQEDEFSNYTESSNNIDEQLSVAHIQQLYKMVFVLYAVEGYKHQEISKMLNITEGTSKSQLFKARKLLQEKLTNKGTGYDKNRIKNGGWGLQFYL